MRVVGGIGSSCDAVLAGRLEICTAAKTSGTICKSGVAAGEGFSQNNNAAQVRLLRPIARMHYGVHVGHPTEDAATTDLVHRRNA